MWGKAQLHSFVYEYVDVQASCVENTVLSCIKLSWHPCQKSIDHRYVSLFLDFQVKYYVIYMFVLMLVPHWLGYYSSIVSFEIRKCVSSNFDWRFQDCFGYLGPLHFHVNSMISLWIATGNGPGILIEIVLNLQICLESSDIWIMLNLLTHKHGMFFHLFSFFFFFLNFFQQNLWFSVYKSYTSLDKFIP